MDYSKLRQLAKNSRERTLQAKLAEQDTELLRLERMADETISSMSSVLEDAASHGRNEATILMIHFTKMVHTPREKWFVRKRSFSPSCLPHYARRVYDHCEIQGLKTRLSPDPYELDYKIIVEW